MVEVEIEEVPTLSTVALQPALFGVVLVAIVISVFRAPVELLPAVEAIHQFRTDWRLTSRLRTEETICTLPAGDLLVDQVAAAVARSIAVREKALISIDMITGLCRGELAGLKWKDIDFANLLINVIRSVVDQRTGRCKTEASAKPVPIDEYTAEDLLTWYRLTPYKAADDWVFASDAERLKKKRGRQPVWLAKIMQHHIQPLVKRLGIDKCVSWHTFRHTFTSLLTAHEKNIKVVQELLRHASSKTTMDVYSQAEMVAKRRAQLRIVKGLRKGEPSKEGAERLPRPNLASAKRKGA